MTITIDKLREISLPFPSFQPNTLILSEQVNDNNDEIQYRTNLLIKSYLKHVLEAQGLEVNFLEHLDNYNAFVNETGENFNNVNEVAENNKQYLENLTRKLVSDLNNVVSSNKNELNNKIDTNVGELNNKIDNNVSNLNNKIDNNVSKLDNKINTNVEELNNKIDENKLSSEKLISKKGDTLELKNTLLYLKSGDNNLSVADLSGLGGGVGRSINVASGHNVTLSDWTLDDETGLYKTRINHSLVTSTPLVVSYDDKTNFRMFDISKVIDMNNVDVYNDEPIDVFISVINGSSKVELVQAILDDENITDLRTWSSKKIKEYIDNSTPELNASNVLTNNGDNVEVVLSTHKESILQQGKDISAIQRELGINKETLITNTIEIFNLY